MSGVENYNKEKKLFHTQSMPPLRFVVSNDNERTIKRSAPTWAAASVGGTELKCSVASTTKYVRPILTS
jgi:hypothetical protein